MMQPHPLDMHPFLRWHEALMVRLLARSPRVRSLVVQRSFEPMTWAVRKPYHSNDPVELIERDPHSPRIFLV